MMKFSRQNSFKINTKLKLKLNLIAIPLRLSIRLLNKHR